MVLTRLGRSIQIIRDRYRGDQGNMILLRRFNQHWLSFQAHFVRLSSLSLRQVYVLFSGPGPLS